MSGDIKYYREQFKRQKKLEEIVSKRVLKRPKTKKWHVFALFSAAAAVHSGGICRFLRGAGRLSAAGGARRAYLDCGNIFKVLPYSIGKMLSALRRGRYAQKMYVHTFLQRVCRYVA